MWGVQGACTGLLRGCFASLCSNFIKCGVSWPSVFLMNQRANQEAWNHCACLQNL